MRKRNKKKKRSCALCKPFKMKKAKYRDGLELQTLKEFEKEKLSTEAS